MDDIARGLRYEILLVPRIVYSYLYIPAYIFQPRVCPENRVCPLEFRSLYYITSDGLISRLGGNTLFRPPVFDRVYRNLHCKVEYQAHSNGMYCTEELSQDGTSLKDGEEKAVG
jgi:hypothetical protein